MCHENFSPLFSTYIISFERVLLLLLGDFLLFQPAANGSLFSLFHWRFLTARLILSPSLSHSRFTRETYTLHAIVYDDSVRIHVYARTRKAVPFAWRFRIEKASFCVLVILFFALFRSFYDSRNYWLLNSTLSLFSASLIYLKICKYA